MNNGFVKKTTMLAATAMAVTGCSKPKLSGDDSGGGSSGKFLYVASGVCQAGQPTTYTTTTASNVVYRVNLDTGNRDVVIADYTTGMGESPVGLVDYDDGNMLVLIEKTGARRIEKVQKKLNGARSNFNTDTAALANTLVGMARSKDGGVFVSRTNAIAYISSAGITASASYIAATGGGAACGTTNVKYSSLAVTGQGHLIYLNAEASDNKVAAVKAGPTCMAGHTPTTPGTALMTASLVIPGTNQLLVANAGSTTGDGQNTIQVYEITENASAVSALSAPTEIYDAFLFPATHNAQLFAISAMAWDPDNSHLYVAVASSVSATIGTAGIAYVIEKFHYDTATKTLTRIGLVPFYQAGLDTKCISGLFVGK